MSKALLLSTSTCSWCRTAMRYFKARRVPLKEIDVEFSRCYAQLAPQGGAGSSQKVLLLIKPLGR